MLHNPYSSHYHEVPHPHSPYSGPIPHGLVPGKQIFISGHVKHHADRLQFNFMGRSGYIFHINPRFSENCIVRNTESYGNWGNEERHGPLFFHLGQYFEMIISVEEHRYRVAINGTHAFDYNHRSPMQEADRLDIVGELDIQRIVFSGGHSPRVNETFNPTVPFSVPIAGGPTPGKLIEINGFIPHGANRFWVNLQDGPSSLPPNINLHFNPRFDQNTIVRTNRQWGNYGNEERGVLPLTRGQNFNLLILIEPHEFKAAVNGVHYCSFAHRNQLHEANHIEISGDVQIHSIRQH